MKITKLKRLISFKNGFYGQLQIGRKRKSFMCHKNNEVLWLQLLRGGNWRGGRGERGGKEGEGGVDTTGALVPLSPPNPAPPYKPAENPVSR